jgi:hypothetical protein
MASRQPVFAAASPNTLLRKAFAARQNARENLFCRENFWAGRGSVRFLGSCGMKKSLIYKRDLTLR